MYLHLKVKGLYCSSADLTSVIVTGLCKLSACMQDVEAQDGSSHHTFEGLGV